MSHARITEVEDDSDGSSNPSVTGIDDGDFDEADILQRIVQSSQTQPQASSSSSPFGVQQPLFPHGAAGRNVIPTAEAARMAANYQCIYPIYFDARRSRAEGRRVPANLAVENPLATEIANACTRNGIQTILEMAKTHPQDWANPGRVRIDMKKKPPHINNKHHLMVLIAKHLKENPTTEDSPALKVRMAGLPGAPDPNEPWPRPAVPRGWKLNEFLPFMSPALTGGGVSENLLKDMMKEMQGGADPMSALMGGMGGMGGDDGGSTGGAKAAKGKKGKGKGKA